MSEKLFETTSVFDWNFAEWLAKENKIIINSGGTYCFHPNQLVMTPAGSRPISELTEKDSVLTFDGRSNCYRPVVKTHKYHNEKKTIKVKLKTGHEIICTEDHKFFFRGEWKSIKYIVSLLNEKDTKL